MSSRNSEKQLFDTVKPHDLRPEKYEQILDEFEEELEEVANALSEEYSLIFSQSNLGNVEELDFKPNARGYRLETDIADLRFIVETEEIEDGYQIQARKAEEEDNENLWEVFMGEVYSNGNYISGETYLRREDGLKIGMRRDFRKPSV